MNKRSIVSAVLLCLLLCAGPALALPNYTTIGTATSNSNPALWQTYQFDITQYIAGSSSSTLYFDLVNDAPTEQYGPGSTTAQVFFGVDPDSPDYFAHLEYLSGSDTNHYRDVWLEIDGIKYVDQYGPYNDHLGLEYLGTSWYGQYYDGSFIGRNCKGEIGTFDASTYRLSQLIEVTTDMDYIVKEIVLGDTVTFDYWWKMGTNPPSYSQGCMFDVLALQGGSSWQFISQTSAYTTSSDWQSITFAVPEELIGTKTQLRFVLTDFSPDTDPTVYLRGISSSPAPVPEPTTIMLFGSGLLGLAGLRRKLLG